MRKIALAIILLLIAFVLNMPVVFGEISKGTSLSSDSFKILDSQHSIFGGVASSSSSSFILSATIGDFAIGSSSVTNFGLRSGFLYFPKVTAPTLVAFQGDGRIGLYWTVAKTFGGWSVGGYNIGRATVSGGPYTYGSSLGTRTTAYDTSLNTNLTNGTTYYFVVRVEDKFGNIIATSSEVSATPTADAPTILSSNFHTSQTFSTTLTNSNSTSIDFSIPADALTTAASIQPIFSSRLESAETGSKPLPSGKSAGDTFYDFSFYQESDHTQITSFDKSITLTFTYTDSDISGITESTISAYRWNGSSWAAVSSTLDTSANTVTATTSSFSVFALLGTSSSGTPTPTPAPSGGGGGGGGGYVAPVPTSGKGTIILQGTAYSDSTVSIYVDGVLASSVKAGSTAKFDVKMENINAGNKTIAINSIDLNGRKSITASFSVTLGDKATVTLTDILLAPTIDLNSFRLAKGEKLRIFGQSAPVSEVNIHVASEETITKTIADSNGAYAIIFDTKPLAEEDHTTKSRTVLEKIVSPFSHVLQFSVGKGGIAKSADLNKDRRVSIIDFSILLFWWNTSQQKGFDVADINGDRKINIVDFSIMLFQWTG